MPDAKCILRNILLPVSKTNMFPEVSNATPEGTLNKAVATGPSANPPSFDPFPPAIVITCHTPDASLYNLRT